jgi:hypothetical protein
MVQATGSLGGTILHRVTVAGSSYVAVQAPARANTLDIAMMD